MVDKSGSEKSTEEGKDVPGSDVVRRVEQSIWLDDSFEAIAAKWYLNVWNDRGLPRGVMTTLGELREALISKSEAGLVTRHLALEKEHFTRGMLNVLLSAPSVLRIEREHEAVPVPELSQSMAEVLERYRARQAGQKIPVSERASREFEQFRAQLSSSPFVQGRIGAAGGGDPQDSAPNPAAPASNNPEMADTPTRQEIDAKFEAFGASARADAEGLRREMSDMRGDLRKEMSDMRGELRAGMEALRADFHKTGTDSARWLLATAIGMVVGFGGLFLAMTNALKPPAQATAVVQPAATVAAPAPAPAPAPTRPASGP